MELAENIFKSLGNVEYYQTFLVCIEMIILVSTLIYCAVFSCSVMSNSL